MSVGHDAPLTRACVHIIIKVARDKEAVLGGAVNLARAVKKGLCRKCWLPQVISSDHDPDCTYHPSNRFVDYYKHLKKETVFDGFLTSCETFAGARLAYAQRI